MSMKTVPQALPAICLTGLTDIFIPNDVTYSTYILAFTMFYFIMPMIMVSANNKINAMNYYVIAFFIAYIVLDLFIVLFSLLKFDCQVAGDSEEKNANEDIQLSVSTYEGTVRKRDGKTK